MAAWWEPERLGVAPWLALLLAGCAAQESAPSPLRAPAASPGPRAGSPSAPYDFGDDSSLYAYDGLCSDPRFTGEGMATELDAAPGHDAADCAILFDADSIALSPGQGLPRRGDGSD